LTSNLFAANLLKSYNQITSHPQRLA